MHQIAYFLPAIAAAILAVLEAYRIKQNMGGENTNKVWTNFYAAVGYPVCLIFSVQYNFGFGPADAGIYLGYYVGVRGVVYAPVLNLLRGLNFDYFSKSTNSRLDRLFGSFWLILACGAVVAGLFGWLLYLEGIV
ncbi:hypothetical protein UFOVP402_32 [uncultured Caudovirales phage]|uniref:Uncharacterized protein n=1 Tax=uncultured Caudovirales phage TaxID=2100421 RepID=A0A6J5M4V1_9CAUD|nr:hypothetical protein UFOVP402_32 [uncultured Caudovirales phage]